MRLSFDLDTLVLYDPPEGFTPPVYFQWDALVNRSRTQPHHYRQAIASFEQSAQSHTDATPAYRRLKLPSRLTQTPRPFHHEAREA